LRDSALLLQAWRLAARQIGFDLGHKGLKDQEIVVLLRRPLEIFCIVHFVQNG